MSVQSGLARLTQVSVSLRQMKYVPCDAQSAFTVQLLDSKEQLRSFSKTDLRDYSVITNSGMPSYKDKLSTQELADVVSYLASLKGKL